MSIHELAVIHPTAKIGENTTIEPFAIVGENAVIGNDCHIESGARIGQNTTLGNHCYVSACAIVGGQSQDLKYDGEPTYLKVGSHCRIGEFAVLHRATGKNDATIIGESVNMLAYSHVAHDCQIADRAIIGHRADLGGHVVVEYGANIAANSQVVHFARIGQLSFVTANTFINNSVLPFMTADATTAKGAHIRTFNRIGIKRFGEGINAQQVKAIFRDLVRSESLLLAAIAELGDSHEARILKEFVKQATTGEHAGKGFVQLSEALELEDESDSLEPEDERDDFANSDYSFEDYVSDIEYYMNN